MRWFRKAAEQNFARAQLHLGICSVHGRGVGKDEVEATKWFRKAAEQNDPDAQCSLGLCYAKGEGVTKEKVEADKWLVLSAAQGCKRAQTAKATLEDSMAQGKVAAFSWMRGDPEYFQVNLPVQPGNFGGALLDESGNVSGWSRLAAQRAKPRQRT